jgi:peptide/nickel transport system substrate-binding protein
MVGRSLTVLSCGDLRSVDPGRSYFQFDGMLTTACHRALYRYGPAAAAEPHPDLASSAPEIAAEGRRLTVRLRASVRFSPPVDREVTAADVKYAIERAFTPRVGNEYVARYLGSITGVEAFRNGAHEISGLVATDPRTLVIKLDRPVSPTVSKALALPVTAPVPCEWDRASRGGRLLPACTGPYTIVERSRDVTVLRRNPRWDARTDVRPAIADEVVFRHGIENAAVGAEAVLEGSGMVNGDFMPPPEVVAALSRERNDQLAVLRGAGVCRFVALKTTLPPLDDVAVRRAVCATLDRVAMRAARGGEAAGDVATHLIPPGVLGFEEAGGYAGPDLDYVRAPAGDLELGRAYLSRAGHGEDVLRRPLTVVGSCTGDADRACEVACEQLARLGLTPVLHKLPTAEMYDLCARPDSRVAVCASVGWTRDFPDPEAIMRPLLDPPNWSDFDSPQVSGLMAAASALDDAAQRAAAWARVDRVAMEAVPLVPLDWGTIPNVRSRDVVGRLDECNGTWDVSFTSPPEGAPCGNPVFSGGPLS